MEKLDFINNFRMISYALGGIFFVIMGINGFIQIANIRGTPPVGLFVITVLATSFGVWSIRSFWRDQKNI